MSTTPLSPDHSAGLRKFRLAGVLLLLCFSVPLYQLVRFALHSELYSFILLIPFVSAYFVWLQRDELKPAGGAAQPGWALILLTAGGGLLIVYGLSLPSSANVYPQNQLALAMYAFVLLLAGCACLWLDRGILRILAFPLGFLVFLAPFPVAVELALETFLQHGSAVVSQGLFELIGTSVFRDQTFFRLPGFSMQVAPECSGIRSTVALFITSLAAGQLLLRSPGKRAILALVVVPIALVRNAARIVTIGELCIRVGPHMIDSYIHRQGGPIFFALSLVPFSLILLYLLKLDRRSPAPLKSAQPS